jgi:hypothetical protein
MLNTLWTDITRQKTAVKSVALLRFQGVQGCDLGLKTAYSKAILSFLLSLYAD